MPISKQYLKTKPVCKVTFSVPAENASEVCVAGEFNNWNTSEITLKKQKNGLFKGSINLPKDQNFQFKYLVDGNWANEPEADRFQWNDFADAENSVLEL